MSGLSIGDRNDDETCIVLYYIVYPLMLPFFGAEIMQKMSIRKRYQLFRKKKTT